MKIAEIKRLCQSYTPNELARAEERLLEEQNDLKIEVNGIDEGEKLTHLMAAQWCLNDVVKNNRDLKSSIRNYTQKVRKSID